MTSTVCYIQETSKPNHATTTGNNFGNWRIDTSSG